MLHSHLNNNNKWFYFTEFICLIYKGLYSATSDFRILDTSDSHLKVNFRCDCFWFCLFHLFQKVLWLKPLYHNQLFDIDYQQWMRISKYDCQHDMTYNKTTSQCLMLILRYVVSTFRKIKLSIQSVFKNHNRFHFNRRDVLVK